MIAAGTGAAGATACIACGSDGAEPVFTARGYEVTRCSCCGLGRTTVPSDFDPKTLYDAGYFQGGHHDGYADYRGSREVLRHEFRSTLRRLKAAGATHGRLLEIGCAYGYFLDEARESFEVWGIEVAADAIADCRARGLDVSSDSVRSVVQGKGPFDAAVMLDVIEHLERPDEVLGDLAAGLRPGARLMLTTGDWSSWLGRVTGRHWRLMTPPQHLWFFTPASLRRLLAGFGLRVVTVEHPWKRVPIGLALYQLFRGTRLQGLARRLAGLRVGVPVNLFDAMRVVAERT